MITLTAIREAWGRVSPHVNSTCLLPAPWLEEVTGRPVFLKPENLQITGSFKVRGAANLLISTNSRLMRGGVITASSGNHGLGIAYMGARLGIPVTVVIPESCASVKRNLLDKWGARSIVYGRSSKERRQYARTLAETEDILFVHSHDDPLVIAGQGTIGLEILAELPEVGAVLIPVGGGGLIAGIATAIKEINPNVLVYGVEPEIGCCMKQSLDKGEIVELLETPSTIADGLRGTRPGEIPFSVVKNHVDGILTVSEEAIEEAVRRLHRDSKLVVEPSGAVVVAALMEQRLPKEATVGPVCTVLSGGNMDNDVLIRILEKSKGES